MEKRHRDAIQKNFSSLVEQTDLDLMVSTLYEKGVFSDLMIEPYKDITKELRMRKRQLYRDITRRGPDAFCHLLDSLSENGYWALVRDLDPNSLLQPRRPPLSSSSAAVGSNSFVSLSEKRITGKEQDDPNQPRFPYEKKEDPPIDTPPSSAANGELPQFHVVKSTRFYEDNGNDIKLYRTRGRKRGVLVLFSYISFKHEVEEYRAGARVDADNLRYLFTELGFKVLSYLNLSLEQTQTTLSELKNGLCGEGVETVFVVFSSHGYARAGSGDTDIRCSDGQLISYYKVIDYFNNDSFPALNGTPKVFIFQTCRGSNKEYVHSPQHLPAPRGPGGRGRVQTDGCVYAPDSPEPPAAGVDPRDRVYSDILIAHSTVPGYVSNRDRVSGSWYIQALCEEFSARAHDCHVEKLFTLVDERLRRRFRTQTSSIDRWGFNRRLYLHPGLVDD